jgi:gluconate 2-dehydrogenase gamma chain
MSTHDKARRAFLIQTAAGMGAAATAGLATEAQAQDRPAATPTPDATAHSQGEGVGAFFNIVDASTIAALTERIMPGAPGKPGAKDAGVLNYIDLALSGAYSSQQEFYRQGLTQLDAYCNAMHKGSFVGLTPAQQDDVITALEAGKATGFNWPTAKAFFNTIRRHTMEGMFADPVYGRNKDFAGWRLVGFPGAQVQFTQKDMRSDGAFTRVPIIGMQS